MPEPWKTIFDRREALEDKHRTPVRAAWAAVVDTVNVSETVDSVNAWLATPAGLVAAAADPTPGLAAGITVQQQLQADEATRKHLQLVIADALLEGDAEGQAVAQVLIAEVRALAAVDFDLAFAQAMDALGDGSALEGSASDWVDDLVGGYARDVGRVIASGIEDGATRAELEGLVADVLGDVRGVDVLLDYAISNALTDGAVAVYADENVAQVDFFTAGDDRVDDECVTAEVGSPYALADAPKPALHIGCRCTLAPSDDALGTRGYDAVQDAIEQTSEGGD